MTWNVEGSPRADAIVTIHATVPFGRTQVPLKICVRRSAIPNDPDRASRASADWVALMVWHLIYAAFKPPSRKAEVVVRVPGPIPSTVSVHRRMLRVIADAYGTDSAPERIELPQLFPEFVEMFGSGEFVDFLRSHRPRIFQALFLLSWGLSWIEADCVFPQPRGRQREKAKLTRWVPMALLMAHQLVADAAKDLALAEQLDRLRTRAREAFETSRSPDRALLAFLSRYPDGLRNPLACAVWLVDRAFGDAWASYGVRRPVEQFHDDLMDRVYGERYLAPVVRVLQQVAGDFPRGEGQPGLKDVILHNWRTLLLAEPGALTRDFGL